MADYEPMMSPERVEMLGAWHQSALRGGRRTESLSVDYLGLTLVIPPSVFAPTPTSDMLGRAVLREVKDTDRVLDMGTGSGVNAILAASRSTRVVAVDVNPDAVAAATENADRNGVGDRVSASVSDVFANVEGRFDLIVFDPPFRWFPANDLWELSMADEGYRAMTSFFGDAGSYLADGGRMLIFFGKPGDIDYLESQAAAAAFEAEVLDTRQSERDGVTVDYFTYRMTLRS